MCMVTKVAEAFALVTVLFEVNRRVQDITVVKVIIN